MNDWIKSIAPTLGTALLGPFGGIAATFLADKLGVPEKTVKAVTEAIGNQSLTPDQLTQIKLAEQDFKKYLEDNKIKLEELYVSDVQNARQFNANTHGILYLGYGINFLSYICVFAILYGCFAVINGQKIGVDPGLAAMVGSVVGAVVQWLMSNAAQANAFFFGSSPSSRQHSSELAKAVGEAVGKVK